VILPLIAPVSLVSRNHAHAVVSEHIGDFVEAVFYQANRHPANFPICLAIVLCGEGCLLLESANIFELDAMLGSIGTGFGGIPLEVHPSKPSHPYFFNPASTAPA
jgi:hypothetical protein